eukprot:gene32910-39799_t
MDTSRHLRLLRENLAYCAAGSDVNKLFNLAYSCLSSFCNELQDSKASSLEKQTSAELSQIVFMVYSRYLPFFSSLECTSFENSSEVDKTLASKVYIPPALRKQATQIERKSVADLQERLFALVCLWCNTKDKSVAGLRPLLFSDSYKTDRLLDSAIRAMISPVVPTEARDLRPTSVLLDCVLHGSEQCPTLQATSVQAMVALATADCQSKALSVSRDANSRASKAVLKAGKLLCWLLSKHLRKASSELMDHLLDALGRLARAGFLHKRIGASSISMDGEQEVVFRCIYTLMLTHAQGLRGNLERGSGPVLSVLRWMTKEMPVLASLSCFSTALLGPAEDGGGESILQTVMQACAHQSLLSTDFPPPVGAWQASLLSHSVELMVSKEGRSLWEPLRSLLLALQRVERGSCQELRCRLAGRFFAACCRGCDVAPEADVLYLALWKDTLEVVFTKCGSPSSGPTAHLPLLNAVEALGILSLGFCYDDDLTERTLCALQAASNHEVGTVRAAAFASLGQLLQQAADAQSAFAALCLVKLRITQLTCGCTDSKLAVRLHAAWASAKLLALHKQSGGRGSLYGSSKDLVAALRLCQGLLADSEKLQATALLLLALVLQQHEVALEAEEVRQTVVGEVLLVLRSLFPRYLGADVIACLDDLSALSHRFSMKVLVAAFRAAGCALQALLQLGAATGDGSDGVLSDLKSFMQLLLRGARSRIVTVQMAALDMLDPLLCTVSRRLGAHLDADLLTSSLETVVQVVALASAGARSGGAVLRSKLHRRDALALSALLAALRAVRTPQRSAQTLAKAVQTVWLHAEGLVAFLERFQDNGTGHEVQDVAGELLALLPDAPTASLCGGLPPILLFRLSSLVYPSAPALLTSASSVASRASGGIGGVYGDSLWSTWQTQA